MNPDTQLNPIVLLSSFFASQLVTWAYRHPAVKWVNKETIRLVSVVLQAVVAAVVLWLSGDLTSESTQTAVQAVLELVYHVIVASGMGVAFHEWQKPTPNSGDNS